MRWDIKDKVSELWYRSTEDLQEGVGIAFTKINLACW
jgi:hypothetical protein